MTNQEILNLKTPHDNLTIKEYLYELLTMLWEQGEGFSGKRPFGNSGWEHDIYQPLVANGVVEGTLDENGYIEDMNTMAADKLVFELINTCFE